MKQTSKSISLILAVIAVLVFGIGTKNVSAQTSPSVLYVPLIGLTSVPTPLALPNGAGNVTYKYAVKNFLAEMSLSNISVVDDKCASVIFVEGDDNGDSKLDYDETWRYTCTTRLSATTQSTAIATGTANDITATHKAYAMVVVGSNTPPPLVSIVNITKVAYPLSLPAEGGDITYTYRVNNPGVVPLSFVSVTDDKCSAMSNKLGDRNANNLLDVNEVWVYTCTTTLRETTTNTVTVTAFANGLQAIDEYTLTVKVETPGFPAQPIPSFPETGENILNVKITVWQTLAGILAALMLLFVLNPKNNFWKTQKKPKPSRRS